MRRTPLRAAATLLAALVAVPVLAGPSAAAGTVTPLVTCQVFDPVRNTTTFVLGYENTGDAPVTYEAGTAQNFFNPEQRDRGQPTTFLPGRHPAAFTVSMDYAVRPAQFWVLGEIVLRADMTAPACTSVTTTSLSAPDSVATGLPVTVVATVQSVLALDPRTGTVDLAVDGDPVGSLPVGPDGTARFTLPALAAGSRTISASFAPDPASAQSPSSATTTLDVVDPGTVTIGPARTTGGTASVTITRAGAAGTASVDWATADGTAVAGEDYTASGGTVTFAEGETTATVSVPVAARPPGAPAERFFVLLQRATVPVGQASAAVLLAAGPTPDGGSGGPDGGGTGVPADGAGGGTPAGGGTAAGSGSPSSGGASTAGVRAASGLAATGWSGGTGLLLSGCALLLAGGAVIAARRAS